LISPYGEEIIKIPLNTEGVKTTRLMSRLDETIYKKFGDYIFIISILFILFINRLIGLKNNFIRF
jgi:apolipoprotein N-acyltransferase